MKIQDLRIGNWVIDIFYDMPIKITKHFFSEGSIDSMKPIELTEEILLKCGFKFKKYYYCIYINEYSEFIIAKNNGDNIYYLCDIDINVNIKYLHQLQNLYWCLCGEELNIQL